MKAAIVLDVGRTPVYGDFKEPDPRDGLVRVHVTAAALSNLVRGRASGTHYSSASQVPFVVGVDGVGRLDDGRRVYFAFPEPPLGSMSELTAVNPEQCIDLPDDIDDVIAAAIANPGMSAWAAMKERANFVPGETVLVNGATGISGRLAVQIAKFFGAKKIIATGRNVEILKLLETVGADVTIPLIEDGDALQSTFEDHFAQGVDVVVDYLWGQSAERLLAAGARAGEEGKPIRFVQIGAMSGPTITLPAASLRSNAIELMGSGLGSVSQDRLLKCIEGVMHATVPGGFEIATQTVPLSEVEQTWSNDSSATRIVFKVSQVSG